MSRSRSLVPHVVADILLIAIFVTIIVLTLIITLAGYVNHRNSLHNIEKTVKEASTTIKNLPPISLKQELETLGTRLEILSKEGIEASTISFLFHIFSICIVSTGVYLVSRAHRDVDDAESRVHEITTIAEHIGPFVNNASVVSALTGYILNAYHTTWLARTARGDGARSSYVAPSRDFLKLFEERLHVAKKEGVGINPDNLSQLIDQTVRVNDNLNNLPPRVKEKLTELSDSCDRCLNLLRERPGFAERYQEQLQLLGLGNKQTNRRI